MSTLVRRALAWWRENFAQPTELRKVTANTLWVSGGYVLRLSVSVFVTAWMARYLGTEQYGALNFAASFAGLFAPVIALGLERIAIRDVVREPDARGDILGTTFALRLGVALLTVPVAVSLAALLRPGEPVLTWLVLFGITGQVCAVFDVVDYHFQADVKSKYVVQVRNLVVAFVLAVRVIALARQAPLIVFGIISLLEFAAYAAGLVIVYRRVEEHPIAWRASLSRARRLLATSWPLLVDGIMIVIYMRLDQTLLVALLPGEAGTSAVGVYSAAVRISEVWYFVPLAINASLFPTIIKSREVSETLYRARLQRYFNFMVLLSYAIAIPMTVLSGPIVELLYGPAFRNAAPMLIVLAWAGVWTCQDIARGSALQVEGYLVQAMLVGFLAAALNVTLNLLLIPSLAGLGCAIATTAAYMLSGYLSSFLFPRLRWLGRMQTRALLFPNPFRAD